MAENIVGRFATTTEAEAALAELQAIGLVGDAVSLIQHHPATEQVAQSHGRSLGAPTDDATDPLAEAVAIDATEPSNDAFLIVRAHDDGLARRALDILQRYQAVDVEHREAEYQPGSWEPIAEAGTATGRRARMYPQPAARS